MSEFEYQEDSDNFDYEPDIIDFDDGVIEPGQKAIKRSKEQTRREIEMWHEDKWLSAEIENYLDDCDYHYDRDIDYDFN